MCISLKYHFTVWKFQKFPATLVFREINSNDSRSAKSATLTPLERLKFAFSFIFAFKAEICRKQKIRAPEIAKMAFL